MLFHTAYDHLPVHWLYCLYACARRWWHFYVVTLNGVCVRVCFSLKLSCTVRPMMPTGYTAAVEHTAAAAAAVSLASVCLDYLASTFLGHVFRQLSRSFEASAVAWRSQLQDFLLLASCAAADRWSPLLQSFASRAFQLTPPSRASHAPGTSDTRRARLGWAGSSTCFRHPSRTIRATRRAVWTFTSSSRTAAPSKLR